MRLNVTVTKTSDGLADYIQIMSEDALSVNIVLVAEEIRAVDHRAYTDRHEGKSEPEGGKDA